MKKGIKEGEKLVIIQNDNQLILRKMEDFDKNLEENLEFVRRTKEAYKRIKEGKFIKVDSENLFDEMDKL